MSEIRNVLAGTCCLCFCVWGHTSQYCTPVCLPKSASEMILFSSARCSLSPPVLLLVCILPSFHAEIWMVAHFLKRDIERQAFQAFAKCIYLATCQPRGEFVVANVTVKGNWQGGSFSEVFQACALFCHPLFSSLTCHACKCCPVIGHCVLTNFISTNWAKVIGVML